MDLLTQAKMLTRLILNRSYADNHSHCEFEYNIEKTLFHSSTPKTQDATIPLSTFQEDPWALGGGGDMI